MTGTGAIAIAAACAVPGTLPQALCARIGSGGDFRFGHPSGTLTVGARVRRDGDRWAVTEVSMSRSARRLMDGHVYVAGATPD
jgi:2-methylaconitate cis-trans-isomerase PrpF